MKNNLPVKKIIEIETVKRFVINNRLNLNESRLNVNPDEPSDVSYDGVGYQVVLADFEFWESLGKTPKDSNGVKFIEGKVRGPDDIWKDFVLNPLKKKGKYGMSAKGITLLINSHSEPPWLEEQINIAKSLSSNIKEMRKLYFDEIYIVFPWRNQKIYP